MLGQVMGTPLFLSEEEAEHKFDELEAKLQINNFVADNKIDMDDTFRKNLGGGGKSSNTSCFRPEKIIIPKAFDDDDVI